MQTTSRNQQPCKQQPEKEEKYTTQLFVPLSEETTQHSTTKIARKPTSRKCAGSNIRSLAELVAARKGKCIRNSKHNRNNCTPTNISISTPFSQPHGKQQLTNQTQPNKMQSEDGNNPQSHPTNRLRIQRQPKESFVCSVDLSGFWVCRLENPVAVARLCVYFVPPA
jgi:hypothetical protein